MEIIMVGSFDMHVIFIGVACQYAFVEKLSEMQKRFLVIIN
jgi:hypothetical protein